MLLIRVYFLLPRKVNVFHGCYQGRTWALGDLGSTMSYVTVICFTTTLGTTEEHNTYTELVVGLPFLPSIQMGKDKSTCPWGPLA